MKTTITETMFLDSFKAIRPDDFSYNGLRALFEYLEQLEETGEQMECDVIALCCDFSEYESAIDVMNDYHEYKADCPAFWSWNKEDSEEEREEKTREWLYDNTQVIEFEGGIIISAF